MSQKARTWLSAGLAVLAFALYAADLLGLKPPPRIIPSVVLGIAAVVVGVRPRAAAAPDTAPEPAVATAGDRAAGSEATPGARVMVGVGFALLALLLLPVVPVGLVAPAPGIIVIHGVWIVAFVAAWRLRRSNPWMVLALPFLAAAVIAGTLWFGSAVLGWRP